LQLKSNLKLECPKDKAFYQHHPILKNVCAHNHIKVDVENFGHGHGIAQAERTQGGWRGICEYMQNLLMKCKCQFLEVGWFWTLIPIFTSLYWNFIAIISCFNDTLRSHTYISGDDIHCKSQCTLMHQNFTFKTLHNNQSPNHSTS